MLKNSLQMSSYDLTKSLAHCTTLQQRFLVRVVAFRAVTLLVGHQDKYPVHWVIVGDEVKYIDIDVFSLTCHTATGTHMQYRIT